MIRTILLHAASIAALILGVVLANGLGTPLQITFFIAALLIATAFGVIDLVLVHKNAPKRFAGKRREEKIRKYMTRLLKGDGRCVVSSNDLSWVKDEALHAMLDKAESGSLELLIPSEIDLSRKLSEHGAQVHYYGDDSFRFTSRFTVVNSDRSDAWVAIGRSSSSAHLVREIHENDDPTYNMAKDLIKLAERHAAVRTASA